MKSFKLMNIAQCLLDTLGTSLLKQSSIQIIIFTFTSVCPSVCICLSVTLQYFINIFAPDQQQETFCDISKQ